jgi:hypothetical protein
MTPARFFFLAIFLLGSAALTYADGVPVDPVMDVSDPSCPVETVCPNPIGPNQGFRFTVVGGGGVFMATNQSASDSNPTGLWSSLLFTLPRTGLTLDQITCTSGAGGNAPFGSPCAKSLENDGTVIALLYTISCSVEPVVCTSGIPNNDIFTINLNGPNPWPAVTFTAYPNADRTLTDFRILTPVPEPATLTLLAVGMGALVAKRRFRSQRQAGS